MTASERDTTSRRCDGPSFSTGERFSLRKLAALEKRVLVVAILLSLVVLGAYLKSITDVSSELASVLSMGNTGAPESGVAATGCAAALGSCRSRIIVLFCITVICVGSAAYLFARSVVMRLNAVSRAVDQMTHGNLNVTVPSHAGGEIGNLGDAITELSVNFQEILLLTGTAAGNSLAAVERMEELMKGNPISSQKEVREELGNQVQLVRNDLEMLVSVVKDFEFYQTEFDGRKVVSSSSTSEP
jgi:methyl-accepting chemotaxis protein